MRHKQAAAAWPRVPIAIVRVTMLEFTCYPSLRAATAPNFVTSARTGYSAKIAATATESAVNAVGQAIVSAQAGSRE